MPQADAELFSYLSKKSTEINQVISQFLPTSGVPEQLLKAMEYSLMAGGKRIRPILALAVYEAFGRDSKEILPIVINIELLHTYSLIHDDLPAMDNDDYRRGELNNHKVYGEAMAILAGDALLTHAFGNMAAQLRKLPKISGDTALRIIEEFAGYTGAAGMVGGQVVDLLAEQGITSYEGLQYIHTHKTGDLIVFSLRIAAFLAGAEENQLKGLTHFGKNIGLAFQIQDDILDIIGDSDKLGKNVGSDQHNLKVTYPYYKGIEGSRQEVKRLVAEAKQAIANLGLDDALLSQLADYLVNRDK